MTIRGPSLVVSLLFGIATAADTHFTSPDVLPSRMPVELLSQNSLFPMSLNL